MLCPALGIVGPLLKPHEGISVYERGNLGVTSTMVVDPELQSDRLCLSAGFREVR